MFNNRFSRTALLLLSLVQATGCGVLLYPERQGQEGGRIDPTVAILDGIGLFFFVIPGLVAFFVDFHQGTIYLPGGHSGAYDGQREPTVIQIDGEVTREKIAAALSRATGQQVDLTTPGAYATATERDRIPRALRELEAVSSSHLLALRSDR